jgi:hypothetical protein
MLTRPYLACSLACALLAAGCGSKTHLSPGADGAAASDAGSVRADAGSGRVDAGSVRVDAGAGRAPGDCVTEADCGGAPCVEIVPGGFRVCAPLPAEATACDPARDSDECCTSADCTAVSGGRCYLNSDLRFCGGALPPPQNICAYDNCTSDADCFGGLTGETACVPRGVAGFPVASCLMTFCRRDSDCDAAPGGVCAPVRDACCGLIAGLACVYPGGCRSNADCATGGCVLDTSQGIGRCDPAGVPCPASSG